MIFLTVEEIIRIHDYELTQTGGSSGIRDRGLLESAAAQPTMGFCDEDLYPTIASKAAALAYSLIGNHAFVDGNKRVAHAAMENFLFDNGWQIEDTIDSQEALFLRLAAGESSRDELVEWIQEHLVPSAEI